MPTTDVAVGHVVPPPVEHAGVSFGRSVAEAIVRWTNSRPAVNRSWRRRRFVTTTDAGPLVSHTGKTVEQSAGRTSRPTVNRSWRRRRFVTTTDAGPLVSHTGKTVEQSAGRTSRPTVNRSWRRRRFVTTTDAGPLVSHTGKTVEQSAGRTSRPTVNRSWRRRTCRYDGLCGCTVVARGEDS